MNEYRSDAISKKVEALKAAGANVVNWEQAIKNPEFREYGQNRGLRLRFDVGDKIHFCSLDEAVFVPTSFKMNGKTYQTIKTLAVLESQKYGDRVIEVPAAIFCRIPALAKEQEILWEDNNLGYLLATAEADYLRYKLLCETGTVEVTWASGHNGAPDLHTDHWYTDKDTNERVCVPDDENNPDRTKLYCYKFKAVV